MSSLGKILHREFVLEMIQEDEDRELGRQIFTEWRDRYVASLCAYLRLYIDADFYDVRLPEPYRDLDWCNAAVSILTIAPEDLQDYFLRSNDTIKNKLIAAVIADGGLTDLSGHFHEVPSL